VRPWLLAKSVVPAAASAVDPSWYDDGLDDIAAYAAAATPAKATDAAADAFLTAKREAAVGTDA